MELKDKLNDEQKQEVEALLNELMLEYNKIGSQTNSIRDVKNILENTLTLINKLLPYEEIINKGDTNGKD